MPRNSTNSREQQIKNRNDNEGLPEVHSAVVCAGPCDGTVHDRGIVVLTRDLRLQAGAPKSEQRFAPESILPVVAGSHTSLTGIAFIKNIDNIEYEAAWIPILLSRSLAVSTPDFWTAYVYSAFQAERHEDFDGEVEATKGINANKVGVFGDVKPVGKWGSQYTGMCAIFAEAVDDGFGGAALRITVAHEIAHALGVDHTTELMDEDIQTDSFGSQSLLELRTYTGP